jgi:hypothetical protein
MKPIINCPDCGKSITINNLKNHQNSKVCQQTKNGTLSKSIPIDESWKNQNGLYSCPYCNKEYARTGISMHIWRNHGAGINFTACNAGYGNGRVVWNKGLTNKTDDRVKRNSEAMSKTYQKQLSEGTYVKKIMGEKARQELSERQSLCNSGGKSKWFEIDGTFVQGTWERDCVLKFNEFSLEWKKVKKEMMVKFEMDNRIRNYTPDIFLPTLGITLEIKGYWWGNDKEKMKHVLASNPELGDRLFFAFKDDFDKLIKATTNEELLNVLKSLTSLSKYFNLPN